MTSSDLMSLIDPGNTSRRRFLAGAGAAGFALAAQPVMAQSLITTSGAGLRLGAIDYPTMGGRIPAYWAMPADAGPFPAVIVVHEIFGVHEHIKDLCRRLAKQGYLAIAPDLFSRIGDPTQVTDIPTLLSDYVAKTPDSQVIDDLERTAKYIADTGQAISTRIAITGFCWGGRITWLAAEQMSNLRCAVPWYGKLVGDRNDMTPDNPVDQVANLKMPVLGLYAGQDQGIPLAHIDLMKSILMREDKTNSAIVVYPDAPHGFNGDYRPTYRKEAATDAWARMLAWFKANGV